MLCIWHSWSEVHPSLNSGNPQFLLVVSSVTYQSPAWGWLQPLFVKRSYWMLVLYSYSFSLSLLPITYARLFVLFSTYWIFKTYIHRDEKMRMESLNSNSFEDLISNGNEMNLYLMDMIKCEHNVNCVQGNIEYWFINFFHIYNLFYINGIYVYMYVYTVLSISIPRAHQRNAIFN